MQVCVYDVCIVYFPPGTVDQDWYVGTVGGQSGIFPKSYVRDL